jgi:PilZ domain/Gram-negative bacterial TonB protein C-terminal
MSDHNGYEGLSRNLDRRHHARRFTALNYIRLGTTNGGIVLNVSEGGLAFTAAEALVSEIIPRFLFQLGDDPAWIEASGRIAWLNDTNKGAGVIFTEIADEDRDRIRRWVSSDSGIHESIRTGRASAPQLGVTSSRSPANGFRRTPALDVPTEFADMFPSEHAVEREAHPLASESLEGTGGSASALRSLDEIFPSENDPRRGDANPPEIAAPPVEDSTEPLADPRHAVLEDLLSFGSQLQRGRKVQRENSVLADAVPAGARIGRSSARESWVSPSIPESPVAESSVAVALAAESPAAGSSAVESLNAKSDPSNAPDAGFPHARVPNFGYCSQPQEDWTKWEDPAAPARRNWLGLAVAGLGLAVLAFVIGITSGRGSFDSLEDSVRALIPDRFQRASNAEPAGQSVPASPAPPADNASVSPNTSTQSQDVSSQPSQPPASQDVPTPATAKEETKPPESSRNSPEPTGAVEDKSSIPREESAPVLIAASGTAARPFRLTIPEVAVSASSNVAVSAEMSVLVAREAGPASQILKRLQPGALVFRTEPFVPRVLARNENGKVTDVQRLSGPPALAERAIGAVREWKYSPTLLDGESVRTEEKITLVFRGPR